MELSDITMTMQLEQLVPPKPHSISCSPPFSTLEVGNDNCRAAIRKLGKDICAHLGSCITHAHQLEASTALKLPVTQIKRLFEYASIDELIMYLQFYRDAFYYVSSLNFHKQKTISTPKFYFQAHYKTYTLHSKEKAPLSFAH